jgi:hypothetical protein
VDRVKSGAQIIITQVEIATAPTSSSEGCRKLPDLRISTEEKTEYRDTIAILNLLPTVFMVP